MTHTASRMNPPPNALAAEVLARAGRDGRRAEERECRIWMPTDQDIGQWAEAIGVDRRAATIALNVKMAEEALGSLRAEELEGLARVIQTYGDDRVGEFADELKRETE